MWPKYYWLKLQNKTCLVLLLIILLVAPGSAIASHGTKKFSKLIGVELKGKSTKAPAYEENTKEFEIKKFEKYGQNFLIFLGKEVRGFHNIEIKINGNEVEDVILTKSTDRGSFHVPWNVSKLKSGDYTVIVSDGSKIIKANFKI